jgi:TonB family protein
MSATPEHDRIRRAAGVSLLFHAAAWFLLSSEVPTRSRPEPVPILLMQRTPLPAPAVLPPKDAIAWAPESVPRPETLPAVREARPRQKPAASVPPRTPLATSPASQEGPDHSVPDAAGPSGSQSGPIGLFPPGAGSGGSVTSSAAPAPSSVPAVLRRPICPQSAVSYPAEARRRSLEGEVTARLLVREDGTIGDVTIVRSAGAALDEAVLEAVRTLRCEPARLGSHPVPSPLPYTVRFVLEDP